MGMFKPSVITKKGLDLSAKSVTNGIELKFTRIALSERALTGDLSNVTSLDNVKQSADLSYIAVDGNTVTTMAGFSNVELTKGYYIKTMGLYAIDPDEGEILYSLSVADESTASADWMPPYSHTGVASLEVSIITTLSNTENVSVYTDPTALVTVSQFVSVQNAVKVLQNKVTVLEDTTGKKTDKGGFAGGEEAYAGSGSAVGLNAKAGSGFSGGDGAQVLADEDADGEYIDAIQLGTGINTKPKTLQAYDYTMMEADGHIPNERLGTVVLTNAVDVFVSNTGDDTSGNGTSEAPYKTIQKAIDNCPMNTGGYTYKIHLAKGVYDESIYISDKTGTIEILGGSNLADSDNYKIKHLICRHTSYLKITGVTFTGMVGQYSNEGLVGHATMFYLTYCKFKDCLVRANTNATINLVSCDLSDYRSGENNYGVIHANGGRITCYAVSGTNNKGGYGGGILSNAGGSVLVYPNCTLEADNLMLGEVTTQGSNIGSYVGNGETRTISTGGAGNVLMLYNESTVFAFVTPVGMFRYSYINANDWSYNADVTFNAGILSITQTGIVHINKKDTVYYYKVF